MWQHTNLWNVCANLKNLQQKVVDQKSVFWHILLRTTNWNFWVYSPKGSECFRILEISISFIPWCRKKSQLKMMKTKFWSKVSQVLKSWRREKSFKKVQNKTETQYLARLSLIASIVVKIMWDTEFGSKWIKWMSVLMCSFATCACKNFTLRHLFLQSFEGSLRWPLINLQGLQLWLLSG